jgi:phosphoribosylglycinamide formyltransferase-1
MQRRIAIFASGEGSNFEAIVRACQQGRIDAECVLLVCDKPGAKVVERAERLGVESFVFSARDFESKAAYEAEIVRRLDEAQVELVCLAGYMRIVGEVLLGSYEGRIINIHPSLLPKHGGKGMYGIRVQEAVLAAGDKEAGCTVHYVSAEVDGGGIIAQEAIAVAADDTPESLAERVQQAEKALLPQVVGNFVEG